MKKVGIMTHHRFYNQGTMLQAYALQKKIELLGCEAELIDYKEIIHGTIGNRIYKRICHPLATIEEIRKIVNAKKNQDKIKRSQERYDEFYKNLNIGSEKYNSQEELRRTPPNYDIYMVGSDQTWNPYLPINTEAYYLSFVPEGKKKTSYAPSIGVNQIPEEKKTLMKKWLTNFEQISCREKNGCELLENILNTKVEEVLDPTFLISESEWNAVSIERTIKEKYMICYFLGNNSNNIENAEKIAKLLGLKTYYIYTYDSKINKNLNYLFDVGPAEFLGLIRNADFVCTDSFHGSVFSIIFNKQFCSFTKRKDKGESDNNRIYKLLDLFNIKERYISQDKEIVKFDICNIDYKKVNSILEKERIKSENYLKKCLE